MTHKNSTGPLSPDKQRAVEHIKCFRNLNSDDYDTLLQILYLDSPLEKRKTSSTTLATEAAKDPKLLGLIISIATELGFNNLLDCIDKIQEHKEKIPVKVREFMTPVSKAMIVSETAPLATVIDKFHEQQILIIVDGSGTLAGIITEKDINRLAGAGNLKLQKIAGDIMSKPVGAVAPEDDMEKAANILNNASWNQLIVASNGKPVGFLTQHRLKDYFFDNQEE